MDKVARSVLLAAFVVSVALSVIASPAVAATATVGNGLTTADLGVVGMTPGALASALVGPGVSVSNVTYSGANAQAGLIHLVDPAVVSFNDGVILSSGNIADVVGPNKSDGITGDMAGPADADLNALIADTQTVNPVTFDAASLEFDFVPSASDLYFTYTFASDEYLEWVNLFNDVFAFYVNGQNCATVPNGDPVSIDTINSVVNPSLFRDNSFSSPPANPINIESDGLSVEMICSAPVNAGQTNHMKLAIADTSDQILDSVVMIKAQSLSTTPPESCNDGVDNDDDGLVDMADDSCLATTTPPPPGSEGIGSAGDPPPFTGNEGTPIPLDASALGWTATPDTISTSWTVTGINGTPGTCDVIPAERLPLDGDGSIAVVTATCPNEGEYVAHVFGWDIEGKSSFDMDVDFFVHNAPPAVTIDTPLTGDEVAVGAPVAVSATVTDPGPSDSVTCEISWGDDTTEPGDLVSDTCSGSHTYASVGTHVLSVTATDDAGDSAAAATLLSVVAETPTSPVVTSNPVDQSVLVGDPFSFHASASGIPTPTVQWQVSSDGGTTYGDVPGATDVTIGGTATFEQDGDLYRAVFTNSTGTATSTAALLTVTAPDTTPPSLAPTFSAAQPFLRFATGISASANATDPSGIDTQSCDAVDTSSVGQRTLTCQATDNAGNTATVDVAYIVGFDFAAVSPSSGTAFPHTAAIPVSFHLVDALGVLSDTEATALKSSITITFDGLAGVHPSYNKKTNLFSVKLKTAKPVTGNYHVTIDVVSAAVTIAHTSLTVTIN